MKWSLALANGTLTVDLSIENKNAEPIFVAEQLATPKGSAYALTDRLIVMNGDAPGEVLLARAVMSSDAPAMRLYPASFRKLAPGESMHQVVNLPWPAVWHPVVGPTALRGTPRTAHLKIAWFSGEPPRFAELAGADGSTLVLPEGYDTQWFDGGTQPLPAP